MSCLLIEDNTIDEVILPKQTNNSNVTPAKPPNPTTRLEHRGQRSSSDKTTVMSSAEARPESGTGQTTWSLWKHQRHRERDRKTRTQKRKMSRGKRQVRETQVTHRPITRRGFYWHPNSNKAWVKKKKIKNLWCLWDNWKSENWTLNVMELLFILNEVTYLLRILKSRYVLCISLAFEIHTKILMDKMS